MTLTDSSGVVAPPAVVTCVASPAVIGSLMVGPPLTRTSAGASVV
jgi:hypothetical protein